MLFKNISLLLIVSLCCSLFAAQQAPLRLKVAIVDYNKGHSIEQFISNESSLINIYGATPSYSAFLQYQTVLQEHYAALSEYYKQRPNLKGVQKCNKNFITTLNKSGIDSQELKNYFSNKDLELFKLFFKFGFDLKTLKYNFDQLLKATKTNEPNYMIHILLPCYFTNLSSETDPAIIYQFLRYAAIFYKQIYQQFSNNNLKVCILIPPMEYFKSVFGAGEAADKLKMNINIVEKEIFEQLGSSHKYVLIDQNFDELQIIAKHFTKQTKYNISAIGLLIYNDRFKPSTIFNPYIIKADVNYNYTTSTLLSDQLLDILLTKFKVNANE